MWFRLRDRPAVLSRFCAHTSSFPGRPTLMVGASPLLAGVRGHDVPANSIISGHSSIRILKLTKLLVLLFAVRNVRICHIRMHLKRSLEYLNTFPDPRSAL